MTERPEKLPPEPERAGDENFLAAAGQLLRRSADEIDAATAARLNRARQAALEQLEAGRGGRAWILPAASTAAVGALAVALWLGQGVAPDGAEPDGATLDGAALTTAESAGDLKLLLAEDSLAMLENLDFYAWLDAELSEAELRAELDSTS